MESKYGFGREFQTNVLNLVLTDENFIINFSDVIHPDYFNDDGHEDICKVFMDLYEKYHEVPDRETLEDELSSEHLVDTLDYVLDREVKSKKAIYDKIIKFARTQAVKNTAFDIIEKDFENEVDFENIKSKIYEAFAVGSQKNNGYDYRGETENRLTNYDRPEFSIPTGFKRIDGCLEGGLHRKEQGLIIGSPSGGKTTSLIHLGKIALINGYNVVHYTLELRKERVARRYDMSITGFDKSELRARKRTSFDRINELVKGELVIHEYPSSFATTGTIMNDLRLLEERNYRIDMVIIDYDDLLRPVGRADGENGLTEVLYKEMRGIAFEFDCGVWTATQTNKKIYEMKEGEVLDGQQATGSLKAKMGTPDVVLSMNQTLEEFHNKICRLYIAKNREGEAKVIEEVVIDFSTMSMRSL